MTVTVWPIAAVTGAPAYSGRMLRQAQSVFLAGATSARPLGARSGVRPGTSVTTCSATSTVWTIGPHAGIMDVEVAAECGPYGYAVDAAITGAMTAAHATLARVDILWMRVDDPPEDGTSVPLVAGGYTAGTAASTPAAPVTPARCMVLGWVNVPASGGGAPTVTWVATPASTEETFRLGDTAALKGTAPALTAAKIRQEFTAIITIEAGGAASVLYPTAFANGITFTSAQPGDIANSLGHLVYNLAASDLSAWRGFAYTHTGVLLVIGTVVRVNFVAVGW